MPLYEFICPVCGKFEEIVDFGTSKLECPKCKQISLKIAFSKTGMPIFNGHGFYQTDYKKKEKHENI